MRGCSSMVAKATQFVDEVRCLRSGKLLGEWKMRYFPLYGGFPPFHTAGAAAQFNRGVSAMPVEALPKSIPCALGHGGYTASCSACKSAV